MQHFLEQLFLEVLPVPLWFSSQEVVGNTSKLKQTHCRRWRYWFESPRVLGLWHGHLFDVSEFKTKGIRDCQAEVAINIRSVEFFNETNLLINHESDPPRESSWSSKGFRGIDGSIIQKRLEITNQDCRSLARFNQSRVLCKRELGLSLAVYEPDWAF